MKITSRDLCFPPQHLSCRGTLAFAEASAFQNGGFETAGWVADLRAARVAFKIKPAFQMEDAFKEKA